MLLSTCSSLPADGERWALQPKWDGVRVLACVRAGRVTIISRHGTPLSGLAPTAEERLRVLPEGTVVDGELIALGRAVDGRVQQHFGRVRDAVFTGRPDERLAVVAWDVLFAGGENLRDRGWVRRQEVLADLVVDDDDRGLIRCPEIPLAQLSVDRLVADGFEGAVAKRRSAPYRCGERSAAWAKLKARHSLDAVVVHIGDGRDGRRVLVEDREGVRSWCADRAGARRGEQVHVQFARRDLDGSLRDARTVVQSVVV